MLYKDTRHNIRGIVVITGIIVEFKEMTSAKGSYYS
ncbi:hypothetical protein UNH69_22990 [Chitinophaga sp. 212800008-4]|jgi:hypothetical protein